MAFFRVVRLQRSGPGQFSQLAMYIPRSDGRMRIVKVDYDGVCSAASLTNVPVFHVDVQTMLKKAHVLQAIEADCAALRVLLPEYEEVRGAQVCHTRRALHSVTLPSTLCCRNSMSLRRISRRRARRRRCPSTQSGARRCSSHRTKRTRKTRCTPSSRRRTAGTSSLTVGSR